MKRKKLDFVSLLLFWYKQRGRNLPFRKTKDPYLIWLSEIILQQTQMSTGVVYYNKFKNKFPSLKSLSEAKEDNVIKLWEGLGYYNRVKNLHKTAKYIMNNLNGVFPNKQKELIKLQGIGKYTASAIASICFKEKTPAIDANVFRVFSRVFGIKKDITLSSSYLIFYKKSLGLIKKTDAPGEYNQSLMDFGSLQCLPKKPLCKTCVLNNMCYAFLNDKQKFLPVKKRDVKKKTRFFYYFVIRNQNTLLIHKREKNDIWKKLYDFFLIEKNKPVKNINRVVKEVFLKKTTYSLGKISYKKTKLSHQIINVVFVEIKVKKVENFNYIKRKHRMIGIREKNLLLYAKPKVINDYLEKIF